MKAKKYIRSEFVGEAADSGEDVDELLRSLDLILRIHAPIYSYSPSVSEIKNLAELALFHRSKVTHSLGEW